MPGCKRITTTQIDGVTQTIINYQEFTNRTFDSGHNCLNQMVLTYTDSTKATFLDCQELGPLTLPHQASQEIKRS